jgi:plasmid stabilization system protein ParE
MTARYKVIITPKGQADNHFIQSYLIENYGPEKADKWEERFFNTFLPQLSKTPHFKVVSHETVVFPLPVRCALYCPTKSSAGYHVYLTIEEFQRPDPEPTQTFIAGIVKIIGIRSASMAPLTEEEIDTLR